MSSFLYVVIPYFILTLVFNAIWTKIKYNKFAVSFKANKFVKTTFQILAILIALVLLYFKLTIPDGFDDFFMSFSFGMILIPFILIWFHKGNTELKNNTNITSLSHIKEESRSNNIPKQQIEIIESSEDKRYFCAYCGTELKANSKYCDSCGNKVIENNGKQQCYNCGNKSSSISNFCQECGHSFSKSKTVTNADFGNGLGLKFFNFFYTYAPGLWFLGILYISMLLYSTISNFVYMFDSFPNFAFFIDLITSILILSLLYYFRYFTSKETFSRALIYINLVQISARLLFVFAKYALITNDSYQLLIDFTVQMIFNIFIFIIIYYFNRRLNNPIFRFMLPKEKSRQ